MTIYFLMFACSVQAATYYIDPNDGNDNTGNGSSENPWKTPAYAEDHIVNGSTVYLRSGNYGSVIINRSGLSRTGWNDGVVWTPDVDSTPVFDSLRIGLVNGPQENRYDTFQNLTITNTPAIYDRICRIDQSSYIKIFNCTLSGINAPSPTTNTASGIYITGYATHYNDITIDGCLIHGGMEGISIVNNYGDIIIQNCNIYGFRSNFINIDPGSYKASVGSVLITNNHIGPAQMQPEDAGVIHSSGIALNVACNNITIKKNIIHGVGSTSGVCIYPGSDPNARCDNFVFENNLVYDPQNAGTVRFQVLGTGVVIRNNTIVGTWQDSVLKTEWTGDVLGMTMYQPISSWSKSAVVADWNGVSFYNNAIIGCDIYTQSQWDTMLHGNNLYWALKINVAWQTSSPVSDGSVILTNGTDIIEPVSDIAYFYISGKMFVGGADFETYTMIRPTHYQDLDNSYQLANGSFAINYGDAENQPADSLGTLEPNGFISNGSARNSNYHSVGAYEYMSQSAHRKKMFNVKKRPEND